MSDFNNNHVIRNISPMTDRQSLTNTIFNNNSNIGFLNNATVHEQPFITNILSSMPPPPPPAAFALPPKLNPSAPSFTPGANDTLLQYTKQLDAVQKQQQDSLAKLQVFSVQLNALQLLNEHNPSNEALKQYQNLYQQYNMQFTNTLLLNQCINNINALILTQTDQTETAASNRLETIEEEGEDNDGDEGRKSIGEELTKHTKDTNYASTDTGLVLGESNEEKVSELDKIKKQIRGILNKMTAENFDKLSKEMANILKVADIAFVELTKVIESKEEIAKANKAQFKALIKLILKCILEKAINDALYTNQYARLCYSLYLYAEHDELKKKLLRQQLLSLSHSIFKKARNNGDNIRFIGIIIMIGELFRYGLISWNVIISGIFEELLPPQTPLDIEGVCKMLKTAGHDFDRHHYTEVNAVIHQLSKYSERYDFRTRCFVKEIQEIRGNDWKQNQKKNKNKKQQKAVRWRSNNQIQRGQRWRGNKHRYNGYKHKSQKTRPTVEFIGDVTLPDRSHYPPNKILTKTWAMKNAGDSPWGHNVELVYFKGDETLSLERRYPVMNVAARQTVEISAAIKTPTKPGRYCTYFRLQKNGKYFGPRVWVDIIVS